MATELIGNIKGVKGDIGETPHLMVGTVTTLPAGEDAYVTLTGTGLYPELNFGIPIGEKGDTGDVTEEQMDEAIATAEATVRPISAGGTGESQRRIEISSSFTPYSTNVTGASFNAYYYPYEKRCYFRFYAKTNKSFNATADDGYEYLIGTFGSYKPSAVHIMSARVYKPVNYASIGTDGTVVLKTAPNNSFGSSVDIYITGWWFYDA